MTDQTQRPVKDTVILSVSALLGRHYARGTIFSGKDERGKHIRVVANPDALARVPIKGEVWEAWGQFRTDPEYGLQFYAERCVSRLPKGRLIIAYLANRAAFNGIGLGKASRLYRRFGDDLPQLLSEGKIEQISEVLRPTAAQALVEKWRENQAESEMVAFLDRHGFDIRLANKMRRAWGPNALAVLNRNPYFMLAFAGWGLVDRAARHFGVDRFDPRRLIGAVEAVLYSRLHDKHTLTNRFLLIRHIRDLLGADLAIAEKAIALALADKAITGTAEAGYQPMGAAAIESGIAQRFRNILNGESARYAQGRFGWRTVDPVFVDQKFAAYEASHGIKLNPAQQDAVHMALCRPLSVLMGGAGVGKTTVLKIVMDIIEEMSGTVYAMALSGRAAQRMKEATQREAMTIAGFIHKVRSGALEVRNSPLIIIDEASMLDLPTMYRMLRYLPNGVRFLLVGDPYQLPPIGFGLVFHKLVESKIIPRTELTQVHRQAESTGIPAVALAIRNGIVPELKTFHGIEPGVSFIECSPPRIMDHLLEVTDAWGGVADSQILGITKSGVAGVRAINERYHQVMSLGKPRLSDWGFAIGDPVIHLENDYERLLFNGTLGSIQKVRTGNGEPALVCDFEGCEHIFKESELDKIALAYGITVHKAQGSQFKRVAIPLVKSRILDRTMIYTALTRGIEQVIFIGDRTTFEKAIAYPPIAVLRQVGFEIYSFYRIWWLVLR